MSLPASPSHNAPFLFIRPHPSTVQRCTGMQLTQPYRGRAKRLAPKQARGCLAVIDGSVPSPVRRRRGRGRGSGPKSNQRRQPRRCPPVRPSRPHRSVPTPRPCRPCAGQESGYHHSRSEWSGAALGGLIAILIVAPEGHRTAIGAQGEGVEAARRDGHEVALDLASGQREAPQLIPSRGRGTPPRGRGKPPRGRGTAAGDRGAPPRGRGAAA